MQMFKEYLASSMEMSTLNWLFPMTKSSNDPLSILSKCYFADDMSAVVNFTNNLIVFFPKFSEQLEKER
jgi:hypothetical protein